VLDDVETFRKCKTCGEVKPITEYSRGKPFAGGRRPNCKKCLARYEQENKDRWRRNPHKGKQHRTQMQRRFSHVRRYFRLSREEYLEMIERQGNRCAICGAPPPEGKFLDVDHDHATGRIRALLCGRCNTCLGWANDNPQVLRAAADYLEAHASNISPVLAHEPHSTLWGLRWCGMLSTPANV
jgi:hypothetical protein